MIIMGKVAAAHGIRGWLRIQPFTEYVDSLLDYDSWWIGHENGPWREIEIKNCETHDKTLAVQLGDCPDRNAAEKLKGLLIAVPRSSLPKQDDDEYYWSDLIGLAVINAAGATLGTVVQLLETGSNQVLQVTNDGGEILIPFVASAIKKVDLNNQLIQVDWSADY